MQNNDDYYAEPEYGSDDWAARRGYEIATAWGSTWDEQMDQADDIAAALRELRDKLQPATPIKHPTGRLIDLAGASVPVEVYRLNGQEVVALSDVIDALRPQPDNAQGPGFSAKYVQRRYQAGYNSGRTWGYEAGFHAGFRTAQAIPRRIPQGILDEIEFFLDSEGITQELRDWLKSERPAADSDLLDAYIGTGTIADVLRESQPAAPVQPVPVPDDDVIANAYDLLKVVKLAYRKHHGDDAIGWSELDDKLADVLSNAMRVENFVKWQESNYADAQRPATDGAGE